MISNISKRYARAFFDTAIEENKLELYGNELGQFVEIVEDNRELTEYLANPVFEQKAKKEIVEKILARLKLSPMTANFLKLLVDKKRIDVLADILTCYRQMMDEAIKRVHVSVKTAFPLSADLQSFIGNHLETLTGKKVEIAVEEDRTLLGGIVISVGDTRYDGSIRNQLNKMRNLLGEAR